MHHHRASPAAALLSLTLLSASVLAGCGEQSSGSAADTSTSAVPSASATRSPSSPSSPQPSAGASRHLPRSRMKATRFHAAVLAASAAGTAQERAAVTAWMAYWQAVTDTYYYDREVPGLARVTSTAARSAILDQLHANRAQKQRVVGWARDHVTAVRVMGSHATVRDCTENFTFNVDEEGTPDTRPTPYYAVRGTLARQGGRWVVTEATSKHLGRTCL